jgi:hypothetical protein
MYQQDVTSGFSGTVERSASATVAVARSGQLDALLDLEPIGTRRSFARDREICAEGDGSDCWFRVISGADTDLQTDD